MKRIFSKWVLLLIIFNLQFSIFNLAFGQSTKWSDKARQAVFSIVTYGEDGKMLGTGNGFFVSEDGIHWQFTGKAYSRRIALTGGKEMVLGSLERPQVLFDSEGRPRALFAAVADGPGGFKKASNTWNQVFLLREE